MNEPQASLVEAAHRDLYPNYKQPPLVLARGRGSEVWDLEGKRYLDCYAGIAVSTLGHGHPRLTQAIAEQAAKLIHVSNYFYNEPNIRLAGELCQRTGMQRALFCNSGTEAIEAMLKLARRHHYTRGSEDRFMVIAFANSFHGRTLGALAVTGQPKYRDGFGPLPGVKHVPFGDVAAVRQALDDRVAAILVEPVQGEGGVVVAPAGFLQQLRALCDSSGALLLADEVQTGVGRTGRFLACEHFGVQPDAVALAKGLGGGVPIGAVVCRERYSEALPPGSHGSTFAGNPLASAAALAVLETLDEEQLVAGAEQKGERLARALEALVARYPAVLQETRGLGLLQVLVVKDGRDIAAIHTALREAGLLLTVAGGNALRVSPPLTITNEELDEGVSLIDQVLRRVV
jgi:acetylornithine/N-succinyldiaminopimelate aminotransferase